MATFALDYTIPCFFAHNKLVCTLADLFFCWYDGLTYEEME